MNRKKQSFLWLGRRMLRVEETKYKILRNSFTNSTQVKYMEWVGANNCPDKTYHSFIRNFLKGYYNFFLGYYRGVTKRLCAQEDYELPSDLLDSIPR